MVDFVVNFEYLVYVDIIENGVCFYNCFFCFYRNECGIWKNNGKKIFLINLLGDKFFDCLVVYCIK